MFHQQWCMHIQVTKLFSIVYKLQNLPNDFNCSYIQKHIGWGLALLHFLSTFNVDSLSQIAYDASIVGFQCVIITWTCLGVTNYRQMKRNRVIISNFGSYFRAPNTLGYKYKNISQNIAFPPIKWIYIHCNIVGTYEFSSCASKYSITIAILCTFVQTTISQLLTNYFYFLKH